MENAVCHPTLKPFPFYDCCPLTFPLTCSSFAPSKWATLPYPTQKGQVGGHEGVGVVVKMGPATERAVVKVGQRVGVKWVAGNCGNCPPCLEGYDALCRSVKVSGYYT